MAGKGGDHQGDKLNIGDKIRSPPNPSRPTPRRGSVTVPASNNRSPPPTLRMGVHGVSAFTPFPSRPTPQRGAVPVPAGGNRSPPTSLPLRIGVPGVSAFTPFITTRVLTSSPHQQLDKGSSSKSLAPRQRGLQQDGGNDVGGNERGVVRCSICDKEFQSGKSLFGHMRLHPERGWKGALPPPTFNASEEFADLGLHFQPPRAVPADQPAPPPEPEAPADASGDTADGGGDRHW